MFWAPVQASSHSSGSLDLTETNLRRVQGSCNSSLNKLLELAQSSNKQDWASDSTWRDWEPPQTFWHFRNSLVLLPTQMLAKQEGSQIWALMCPSYCTSHSSIIASVSHCDCHIFSTAPGVFSWSTKTRPAASELLRQLQTSSIKRDTSSLLTDPRNTFQLFSGALSDCRNQSRCVALNFVQLKPCFSRNTANRCEAVPKGSCVEMVTQWDEKFCLS